MVIHERLKEIRTTLKLSQRNFSKNIFLEHSTYARMEQGKTGVNDRIIELICTKYNVSKEYLKNGKGDMFKDNKVPDINLELLNRIFNDLNPLFQDYLLMQARELLKIQMKEGGKDRKKINRPQELYTYGESVAEKNNFMENDVIEKIKK